MKAFTINIGLLGLVLFLACSDPTSPTAPRAAATDLSVGSSGCYAPEFNVAFVPTGDFSFEGVVGGDLEGTVTLEFDPGSIAFAGVAVSNSGTAHWVISGGTIPALGVFDTEFDNRNLLTDRPGSPATLFENIGRHREAGGVRKANLEYNGTFTLVPSPQGFQEYRGVICP